MGYSSDIRFLVPLPDYAKLKSDCQDKYGENSYFNYLEKEEIRKSDDGKEFMYFGWDRIKWYTDMNDSGYQELDDIEDAVRKFEEYHKIRIGESYDDIEEDYSLGESSVDCIGLVRAFEED